MRPLLVGRRLVAEGRDHQQNGAEPEGAGEHQTIVSARQERAKIEERQRYGGGEKMLTLEPRSRWHLHAKVLGAGFRQSLRPFVGGAAHLPIVGMGPTRPRCSKRRHLRFESRFRSLT